MISKFLLTLLVSAYLSEISAVTVCRRLEDQLFAVVCTDVSSVINTPEKTKWRNVKIENSDIPRLNNFFLKDMQDLVKLSIHNSNIKSVDKNTFTGLEYFRELDLSQTRISKIHPGWINIKNQIEKITLKKNNLPESSDFFKTYLANCRRLTDLTVSENHITSIAMSDFEQLSTLTDLSLSHNDIMSIGNKCFQFLQSLKRLDLSDNQIFDMRTDMFTGLESLEMLNLEQNNIRALGDYFFSGMKNLVEIVLSGNSLQTIQRNLLKDISKLEKLWLMDNDIANIEQFAFQHLGFLTELHLSGNNIEYISVDLFYGLNHLQVLSLDRNNIKGIQAQALAPLMALQTLNLSSNSLETLGPKMFSNYNLQTLTVDTNNLLVIQPQTFENTPNLIKLNLGRNIIQNFEQHAFKGLYKLSELILSHNVLETLDDVAIPTLTTLKIDNNQLSYLPTHWYNFSKLQDFGLEGNPWQCACLFEILQEARLHNVDYVDSSYFKGKKPVCFVLAGNVCIRNLNEVRDSGKIDTYNNIILNYT